MKFRLILLLMVIFLALSVTILLRTSITGKILLNQDQFSHSSHLHWTHMPVYYSIKECKNPEKITTALSLIQNQTNNSAYFQESKSPELEFSCEYLENCYKNKTERKWFWIISTEAVCGHEAGIAKIEKIKGNKIIQSKIVLAETEKEENCSETEIHEILHVFGFEHSENPESIMYPEKKETCNEIIDQEIIEKLQEIYS